MSRSSDRLRSPGEGPRQAPHHDTRRNPTPNCRLLNHYRDGPEPHRLVPPMNQWTRRRSRRRARLGIRRNLEEGMVMNQQDITEELHHPDARRPAQLGNVAAAWLQRIRRLPASDPDRLSLGREPDRNLHRGDRAQGGGVVVASGGCADDRCRQHASGCEGRLDPWRRNRRHRRRRSRRVPRGIDEGAAPRPGRGVRARRAVDSPTTWRASGSSRSGRGSSISARAGCRGFSGGLPATPQLARRPDLAVGQSVIAISATSALARYRPCGARKPDRQCPQHPYRGVPGR